MALSIVKRPQGFKISTVSATGAYVNASSTITTSSAHGLSTGNFIYITAAQCVGFWYVTVLNTTTFNVREYATASAYTFIGVGSITYYALSDQNGHYWNALHLPIVYKLQSTLWPINSVDTARTVSGTSNDNGYMKLTLSGALLASLSELEFVKITGSAVAGVYQILSWWSTSIVTINLAYDAGLSFAGATVQYYYNNYRAKIRVYGGLPSSHYLASQKPYVLVCEQEEVPDTTGLITFNINEYLKTQVNILTNNLTKGTLPNNLDAFCYFYITYAEAYDYSAGGYGLLDFIGSYTDDSATPGIAVNADMAFKNNYSGYMSDYVSQSGSYLFDETFTASLGTFTSSAPGDVAWVWQAANAGSAYANLAFGGTVVSERLLRPASIVAGVVYVVTVYYSNSPNPTTLKTYFGSTLINTKILTDVTTVLTSYTFTYTALTSESSLYCDVTTADCPLGIAEFYIGRITIIQEYALKWLTPSVYPYHTGKYFDISFLNQYGNNVSVNRDLYKNGVLQSTVIESIKDYGIGVYRYSFSLVSTEDRIDLTLHYLDYTGDQIISETKTITVDTSCAIATVNLSWLNYLGGFDYWTFKNLSDYGAEVISTQATEKNILPQWPQSYGEGADTVKMETSRVSHQSVVIRAENLTSDQVNDLYRIKLSPLVQIVNSASDRRTVIPDANSFIYYQQTEKLFTLSFTIIYTDENPSQAQ